MTHNELNVFNQYYINCLGNITVQLPDYSAAAYDFIRAFRKGELGKVLLD